MWVLFRDPRAYGTVTALLCHVDDEGGTQSQYHSHSIYRSTNLFSSAEQIATDVLEFMAFQKFIVYAMVRLRPAAAVALAPTACR